MAGIGWRARLALVGDAEETNEGWRKNEARY
jgi:hypothetical protein